MHTLKFTPLEFETEDDDTVKPAIVVKIYSVGV